MTYFMSLRVPDLTKPWMGSWVRALVNWYGSKGVTERQNVPENQDLRSVVFRTGSVHRSQQRVCEVMFQCLAEKLIQCYD